MGLKRTQLENEDGASYDNSRNNWQPLIEKRLAVATQIGYFNVVRFAERCNIYLTTAYLQDAENRHTVYGQARPLGQIAETLITAGLNVSPDDFSDSAYDSFIKLLGSHSSLNSAKPIRTALNNYFRFAVKRRWISKSPKHSCDIFKGTGGTYAKAGCDLKEGIRVAGEMLKISPRFLIHAIQFVLSAHTGLRKKELLRLRVSDVVVSDPVLGPFLKIKGKKDNPRRVPLTEPLANLLQTFFKKRGSPATALLFHTEGYFNRPFTMYEWQAFAGNYGSFGYEGPPFSATGFRRSLAKALSDNGMTDDLLQALYDHDFLSTTWLYIARDNNLVRKMLLDYHPMFIS